MKAHFGTLMVMAVLCVLLSGCAQTGAPLPPSLELPKPPGDLRASRKGDRVALSWSEPTLTTDRLSVRYIGPTLVCRSVENDFTECGNPAALLPAPPGGPRKASSPHQKKSASDKPTPLSYTETLPANLLLADPAAELTFAVEVLNRNARGAGLSNRVHVPAVETLPPPGDVAEAVNGDGVELTWSSSAEAQKLLDELTGKSPEVQVRYRVYRHLEGAGEKSNARDAIAGEVAFEPGVVHFLDSSFEWEKTYLYRVTAVTIVKRADGEVQVEGDDSAPVRVVAHDVFPPSVPTGLQAAYSGEGQKPFIDLIWAPVTSADLAGYNVYRSDASGGAGMVRVNSEPVKSPAYRDMAVESGKSYTYSVSAVDTRGNESGRSEETSEAVP